MSEGVIKSGHREPFTVLYKSAIRDTRLSFEMLGFLTYMLDKPPDWEFTISGMAKERGVGKDTVRRLVGRLEEVGYLMREQSHDGSGRFSANTYVLQEKPPLSENTDNGENRQREKPLTAFPTQPNKDYNPVKIKYNPPIVPPEDPAFDAFWAAYPRHVDKQKARRAWAKLKPDGPLVEVILRAVKAQAACEQWTRDGGAYIPYPATWLNGRRWEDELPGRSESDRSGESGGVNGWET